jgi:hypothetical protein
VPEEVVLVDLEIPQVTTMRDQAAAAQVHILLGHQQQVQDDLTPMLVEVVPALQLQVYTPHHQAVQVVADMEQKKVQPLLLPILAVLERKILVRVAVDLPVPLEMVDLV